MNVGYICEHCDTYGSIDVTGEELSREDVAYCPICGGDIIKTDEEE